jgi:hypothetical protein
MTSAISAEAISPLRRRMIEDMSVRVTSGVNFTYNQRFEFPDYFAHALRQCCGRLCAVAGFAGVEWGWV